MSMMRVVVFRPCLPSLKFVDLPVPAIDLGYIVNRTVSLTFDLSISIWVTGHRVIGFFLANFQLATSFRSRLTARHGTDGQTDDGHQRLTPPPYG